MPKKNLNPVNAVHNSQLDPKMSNSRRQELYNQIRQTSKEEFILSEMLRLGFWDGRGRQYKSEPAELIKKTRELRREMNDLMAKKESLQK